MRNLFADETLRHPSTCRRGDDRLGDVAATRRALSTSGTCSGQPDGGDRERQRRPRDHPERVQMRRHERGQQTGRRPSPGRPGRRRREQRRPSRLGHARWPSPTPGRARAPAGPATRRSAAAPGAARPTRPAGPPAPTPCPASACGATVGSAVVSAVDLLIAAGVAFVAGRHQLDRRRRVADPLPDPGRARPAHGRRERHQLGRPVARVPRRRRSGSAASTPGSAAG